MNLQEALNVFGLSGEITLELVKKAYKKLSFKYHPDRTGNSDEMMKLINAAFALISGNAHRLSEGFTHDEDAYDYGAQFCDALDMLKTLDGLELEIIGNWIWITGDTRPHKDALKTAGCRWAPKKKCWYFRPEEHRCLYNRRSHSMDEIRDMHGSKGRQRTGGRRQLMPA